MTLLVSAGLLLLGAVMALRLPWRMQCGEETAGGEAPTAGESTAGESTAGEPALPAPRGGGGGGREAAGHRLTSSGRAGHRTVTSAAEP